MAECGERGGESEAVGDTAVILGMGICVHISIWLSVFGELMLYLLHPVYTYLQYALCKYIVVLLGKRTLRSFTAA